MPIRCVCFDLGGVMVRITQTWGEAADLAGISLDDERTVLGLSEFKPLIELQAGRIGTARYLADLFEFLGKEQPSTVLQVHLAILRESYPGTLEIVKELNELSITTACLSNTNELHWLEMSKSGRFPNIAAIQYPVLSHHLQLEKPDLAIYRALETGTGYKGDEIGFFDDTPANVEAAVQLGWRAELIKLDAEPAVQIRAALARWRSEDG